LDLSQIFRDGGTLKVFHPPSKDHPRLLPVSLYLKGKVKVCGHPKPPEMGFLGNDSLGKSRILINFAKKMVKNLVDPPRASTEIGTCALAPAVSAEKVEIPGKVDFSHSFQWQKSSSRKSL